MDDWHREGGWAAVSTYHSGGLASLARVGLGLRGGLLSGAGLLGSRSLGRSLGGSLLGRGLLGGGSLGSGLLFA